MNSYLLLFILRVACYIAMVWAVAADTTHRVAAVVTVIFVALEIMLARHGRLLYLVKQVSSRLSWLGETVERLSTIVTKKS